MLNNHLSAKLLCERPRHKMFRQVDTVCEKTLDDLNALERWLANLSDPNGDPWPNFEPDKTFEPINDETAASNVIDPTQNFCQMTDEDSCSEDEEEDDCEKTR